MERTVQIFPWAPEAGSTVVPELPTHNGLVAPGGNLRGFTPEECKEIIRMGQALPDKAALTGDGNTKISYTHRNSRVRQVYPDAETAWIFNKIESAVANYRKLCQFELTGFYEGGQIYHYPTGGYLGWHMDIGLGMMSRRKLGVSVQLTPSDDYEGGDLEFADSPQTAPRDLGAVILFPAYMRHRITEITRGQRDCFVSWVHGPPFK